MNKLPKDKISQSNETNEVPRKIALEIIAAVTQKGAYTNIALEKGLRKLELATGDKHLITEIVNGTIRMIKHLDWVLNLFGKRPMDKQNPWLRDILRMSLYQILFMDKIPEYAAVDCAVNLTRLKLGGQLSKVCNGVLRNVLRNRNQIQFPSRDSQIDYLSVYYSHPEWIVEKCLSEFGFAATENILKYNNLPTGLTLRCNRLKGSREELVKLLRREEVECTGDNNIPWAVRVDSLSVGIHETEAFKSGWFYIQDGSSMLAAPILAPAPEELVYDLCCGVGGKGTHLAEFMQNKGKIKAFDIYEKKLQLLNYNCQRLGITIIESFCEDIAALDDNMPKAQRILLDAPCSGLGVLSRRADLRWHKDPEQIKELISLQKHLLAKAGQMVDKNGRLVYTTCTINKDENQKIISEFLEKNCHFSLEDLNDNLSFLPLDQYDRNQAATGMLTILPGKYLTDGMFYASMRRN